LGAMKHYTVPANQVMMAAAPEKQLIMT